MCVLLYVGVQRMDGLKTSRAGVNSSERSDGDSSKNRGSLANEQRRFFGTIVGDPCVGGRGTGLYWRGERKWVDGT